jgi:hypothetical protein
MYDGMITGRLWLSVMIFPTLPALVGCKKGDAPAPAASAAPAQECTFKNADPQFCLLPPADYSARSPADAGFETRVDFVPTAKLSDTGASGFTVSWSNYDSTNPATYNACQNAKLNANGAVIKDDSKGGCWQDTVKQGGGKPYHYIEFQIKGSKKWIQCMSNNPPDTEIEKILAACRSVKAD